jgi:hypothetical protein
MYLLRATGTYSAYQSSIEHILWPVLTFLLRPKSQHRRHSVLNHAEPIYGQDMRKSPESRMTRVYECERARVRVLARVNARPRARECERSEGKGVRV